MNPENCDCDDWSYGEGCIEGSVYGYCGWDICDGMCEYQGKCECECHE